MTELEERVARLETYYQEDRDYAREAMVATQDLRAAQESQRIARRLYDECQGVLAGHAERGEDAERTRHFKELVEGDAIRQVEAATAAAHEALDRCFAISERRMKVLLGEDAPEQDRHPRTKSATTSPEVASLAARGLADPASLTMDEVRAVCGSALGQAAESEGE